jgi:hypothetical protein
LADAALKQAGAKKGLAVSHFLLLLMPDHAVDCVLSSCHHQPVLDWLLHDQVRKEINTQRFHFDPSLLPTIIAWNEEICR